MSLLKDAKELRDVIENHGPEASAAELATELVNKLIAADVALDLVEVVSMVAGWLDSGDPIVVGSPIHDKAKYLMEYLGLNGFDNMEVK